MKGFYDVIVIGGGHGGIEGAHIASVLNLNVLLVTLSIENIGLLPCNPSIGGPAKSQLVFEIDALGGLMGEVADRVAIQKKMLNLKKGPAVHSLRTQVDMNEYKQEMQKLLFKIPNLDIHQSEVVEILIEGNNVSGVKLNTGENIKGRSVIVATGTYLKSKTIIGDLILEEGPNKLVSAKELSNSLKELGFNTMRFKTGTPPRLRESSIDFKELEKHLGDANDKNYHFYNHKEYKLPNLPCFLTRTNLKTHEIILDNLNKSPLVTGKIKGVGPRYCPSIEDKIMRFKDKDSHHLFLEPESKAGQTTYLQGFSTSMPTYIQEKMIRSLRGLENAHVVKYGYAIEYDVIDAINLKTTLESKDIENLFFAGQINGTSGYEEAGAQGIIAGINAGMKVLNKEPFILKRNEAYIGVLIDDLVTKGTKEPYRMFTARAEYRLLLRQTNADRRLSKKAFDLKLIDSEKYYFIKEKLNKIDDEILKLAEIRINPNEEKVKLFFTKYELSPPEDHITLYSLLKRPEINYEMIRDFFRKDIVLTNEEILEIELIIKYKGYIDKQLAQVKKLESLEKTKIPEEITDYKVIKNLTTESIEKLNYVKPETIGQCLRISGITPADIQNIMIYVEGVRRSNND